MKGFWGFGVVVQLQLLLLLLLLLHLSPFFVPRDSSFVRQALQAAAGICEKRPLFKA